MVWSLELSGLCIWVLCGLRIEACRLFCESAVEGPQLRFWVAIQDLGKGLDDC